MKTIRIFISSPGDVAEERERARQVIDSLKRRYAGVFQLKPVLWEDLPLQADMSFQQGIDVVLSSTGIDLAIFILWSRLGSPQGGNARRPDGTPYRSGTERELDLMLEARRQSGGARPDMLVYTRRDDAAFTERLRGKSTQQQEIEITQKKLVESFITEEFQDATQGINLRAFHSFDRPQAFSQRLRIHLIEMLDAMAGGDVGEAVWDIETQGPPFMGLEAFGEKQALVFCGRDSEILEARRAIAAQAREGCAFLLLTGASGSGKSSLARAGLLPAITEHELDETVVEWRPLTITPSELGTDPIAGLVHRLATPGLIPELRAEGSSLADVADLLAENPASAVNLLLKRALAEASQTRKGGVRLLLLIDQLEELFAIEKRETFLAALEALARSGVFWVVATVRGDFLGEVQKSATLVRLMSGQGLFPVLAPNADALRHMIEEPARLAGLHFEEKDDRRLSDLILADAARHADLLPLVEHVLLKLCDQRAANGALTWQSYQTLGGVEGALSQHADSVLEKLPPSVQATLPAVLKRLVTLSETTGGAEDGGERLIRQRVDLASFPPDTPVRNLVDAFIAERLLTATSGEGDTATVTLAHEALLRVWPTAAAWAGQNRDILRTRARIEARMTEGSPLLKGDPLLDAAKAFLLTHTEDFTPAQRTWIETAIAEAEIHQRRATCRRRLAFTALSILTLLALAGAAWALKREQDANENARIAFGHLRQMTVERWNSSLQNDTEKEKLALLARALRHNANLPEDMEMEGLRISALIALLNATRGTVVDNEGSHDDSNNPVRHDTNKRVTVLWSERENDDEPYSVSVLENESGRMIAGPFVIHRADTRQMNEYEKSNIKYLTDDHYLEFTDLEDQIAVLSPDARFLAASAYGIWHVWNIESGDMVWSSVGKEGFVKYVNFTASSSYLVVQMAEAALWHRIENGIIEEPKILHDGRLIAISSDRNHIAVLLHDGTSVVSRIETDGTIKNLWAQSDHGAFGPYSFRRFLSSGFVFTTGTKGSNIKHELVWTMGGRGLRYNLTHELSFILGNHHFNLHAMPMSALRDWPGRTPTSVVWPSGFGSSSGPEFHEAKMTNGLARWFDGNGKQLGLVRLEDDSEISQIHVLGQVVRLVNIHNRIEFRDTKNGNLLWSERSFNDDDTLLHQLVMKIVAELDLEHRDDLMLARIIEAFAMHHVNSSGEFSWIDPTDLSERMRSLRNDLDAHPGIKKLFEHLFGEPGERPLFPGSGVSEMEYILEVLAETLIDNEYARNAALYGIAAVNPGHPLVELLILGNSPTVEVIHEWCVRRIPQIDESPVALVVAASILNFGGWHGNALEAANKARQILPSSTSALRERAYALQYLGRSREAWDDLLELLKSDPQNREYLIEAGEAGSRLGRTDALDYFERAMSLAKNANEKAEVLFSRGFGQLALGMTDEARKTFAEAAENGAEDGGLLGLALCAVAEGDFDKAVGIASEIPAEWFSMQDETNWRGWLPEELNAVTKLRIALNKQSQR